MLSTAGTALHDQVELYWKKLGREVLWMGCRSETGEKRATQIITEEPSLMVTPNPLLLGRASGVLAVWDGDVRLNDPTL